MNDDIEKTNKKIQKSLETFLDRIDTLSKTKSIYVENVNLTTDFDFSMDDLRNVGGGLLTVGGLAMTGFALGSTFPIIGNIAGAILGAVLGGIIEFIKAIFTSTTSKKAKILEKVNSELTEKTKEIDLKLKTEFDIILRDIKKNSIDKGISLVDELVEMYYLRKDKINSIIEDLENTKIKKIEL